MQNREGLFHLHVGWISRSAGQDVVAASAYRAAARLQNNRKGSASDFTHKAERTLHSEIVVPAGSPDWAADRAQLWNTVEATERRKDARLAAEIEFAIPYGVPRVQWERLARQMAQVYADDGHAVDFALHLGEDGTNPHVHMLLSTRRLTEDGFASKKVADMDKRSFVVTARRRWEQVANVWLSVSGSQERIDHRSYRERGLERRPGRHVRPDPIARAHKRAIFEITRQEFVMQRKPSLEEVRRYPNLTSRAEWPPSQLYPSHDMNAQEREELAAYKRDLEGRELTQRDDRSEFGFDFGGSEQLRDEKEMLEARARDKNMTPTELERAEQAEIHREKGEHYDRMTIEPIDRFVYHTPEERDRIMEARAVSPEQERAVRDAIFEEREARSRWAISQEFQRERERDKPISRAERESMARAAEDRKRLERKADHWFRTPSERDRLEQAKEATRYTGDKRILKAVEREILEERIEYHRDKEQDARNRKLDRSMERIQRERDRDDRER